MSESHDLPGGGTSNENDLPDESTFETIDSATPLERRQYRGFGHKVRPLVNHISELPDGKCIRLPKRLSAGIVSAIRTQLETKHGYRLITRTAPGETFLWRGEKLINR